jgi:hypothetical protein
VVGPEATGESGVRDDTRRFGIVSLIAALVAVPFIIQHAVFAIAGIHGFEGMFADMGGTLPAATQLLISLSHYGILAALMLVIDIGVFLLFYRLAKRYWIGMLFVPVFVYMAITALITLLVYLPILDMRSFVK